MIWAKMFGVAALVFMVLAVWTFLVAPPSPAFILATVAMVFVVAAVNAVNRSKDLPPRFEGDTVKPKPTQDKEVEEKSTIVRSQRRQAQNNDDDSIDVLPIVAAAALIDSDSGGSGGGDNGGGDSGGGGE